MVATSMEARMSNALGIGALAHESHSLAHELYSVLREVDPARWQPAAAPALHARLAAFHRALVELLARAEAAWEMPNLASLHQRLTHLSGLIAAALPPPNLPADAAAGAWAAFRGQVVPAYEALAGSLRALDLPLPSLRPTNYVRNAFHVLTGVGTVLLYLHVLTPDSAVYIALGVALAGWTAEIGRRYSAAVNGLLMWAVTHVSHPHEAHRINSSTWYTTAVAIIALSRDPMVIALALVVLAVGDPAAAIIGRRFGRTRLLASRSLEGTLAFLGVGSLGALAVLLLYFPAVALPAALTLAVAAGAAGALAELVSGRVDDNLSIPLATGLVTSLTAGWLLG
jgi:dolichol kinase